eukprot:6427803-Prymnesium_polylepis.1
MPKLLAQPPMAMATAVAMPVPFMVHNAPLMWRPRRSRCCHCCESGDSSCSVVKGTDEWNPLSPQWLVA